MFYTGALILGYLLKHLYDFRFDRAFFDDPDALVKAKLTQPGHAAVYVVAALVLGVHLSHGFRSAFQSLGVSHPRWTPAIEILAGVVAFLFAAGFAAIPLYFLCLWSESSP
jgi:succinate dehydrogenase / fumarate reductase cytochrome b subunit